jgi:hypothetical protein
MAAVFIPESRFWPVDIPAQDDIATRNPAGGSVDVPEADGFAVRVNWSESSLR